MPTGFNAPTQDLGMDVRLTTVVVTAEQNLRIFNKRSSARLRHLEYVPLHHFDAKIPPHG